MKRYLAGAAAVGCLLAVGAGASSAAVFNPATQTGFISRGDVISAGGKGALIADPVVGYTVTTRTRLTCTWPDSTQQSSTLTSTALLLYHAETRYAGNGTITGYFISPSDFFDGETTPPRPPDLTELCWDLRGATSDGTAVVTDTEPLSTTSALTFFGPTGPFNLGF